MHSSNPDDHPTPALPKGNIQSINESETKILDTRRHPFGLIVIYVETVVALVLAVVLTYAFLPSLFSVGGSDNNKIVAVISVFVFVAIVFVVLFLILATYIYEANRLIITNLNVTQITQVGLFHRKVSEVTMLNIEDVTSQKKGIFQTIFNFGTLHVETAGEQNNFVFAYCPNPDSAAKVLLDTREQFLQRRGFQRAGH